jgi:hypothetical protein
MVCDRVSYSLNCSFTGIYIAKTQEPAIKSASGLNLLTSA